MRGSDRVNNKNRRQPSGVAVSAKKRSGNEAPGGAPLPSFLSSILVTMIACRYPCKQKLNGRKKFGHNQYETLRTLRVTENSACMYACVYVYVFVVVFICVSMCCACFCVCMSVCVAKMKHFGSFQRILI